MNYKITDAHAHVFPEKVAGKAAHSISDFYSLGSTGEASALRLTSLGEAAGVSRFLVCSAAMSEAQTRSINDFMALLSQDSRLIPLGTIYPDYPMWEEELCRIKELGLHGIKLHPDFQKFAINDEKMIEKYRLMAKLGLPVLFHTGDKRYSNSNPILIARLMDRVPELKIVAAHFGGYSEWDDAYRDLPVSDNLYFDTSSSLEDMRDKDQALKMIAKHGVKKFFFGTDFPIWEPKEEIERFLSLGLSYEDNKMIFSENFDRFYNL